jgi:hypothetical protein
MYFEPPVLLITGVRFASESGHRVAASKESAYSQKRTLDICEIGKEKPRRSGVPQIDILFLFKRSGVSIQDRLNRSPAAPMRLVRARLQLVPSGHHGKTG